ncbi:hypothetical protein TWF694_005740 [Orbilia ellipsospora]|uniref:Zn(2)-C6 fungal-type domain-containing protein n=1 Tax=Orbilia ellipsospora TaxID=2528407 RepID=A0AAV9WUC8_9PEZI
MLGATPKSPKKRSSTACGSCKKAKCKCSGPPAPCVNCSSKGRECVFEISLDGRRKESAEVALESIVKKHKTFESLLNCLRSPNDEMVSSLVEAIRKGESLADLAKLVEEQEQSGSYLGDVAEAEDIAGPSGQPSNFMQG